MESIKILNPLNSIIETIRNLWLAVEEADNADKARLKKSITQTISRLRVQIERQLDKSAPNTTPESLFSTLSSESQSSLAPSPRFPEPILRMYSKDLAIHALQHIPRLSDCKSIQDIRKHLISNLRFNSKSTRQRNASYLISRYFPGEVMHPDIIQFAAAVQGTSGLGDALFYLTARTEKIVALVAEEIVFPSLTLGGVNRSKIRDFVQTQFPSSKSAKQMGVSIVSTYQSFGVAPANRIKLNPSLREGNIAVFAYLLHLEFPEPGMYSFERLLQGPLHKWLLWDQQWMISQLYLLREAGLLSKVSEIDRMRQFTTKFPLINAVQPILALPKETPA